MLGFDPFVTSPILGSLPAEDTLATFGGQPIRVKDALDPRNTLLTKANAATLCPKGVLILNDINDLNSETASALKTPGTIGAILFLEGQEWDSIASAVESFYGQRPLRTLDSEATMGRRPAFIYQPSKSELSNIALRVLGPLSDSGFAEVHSLSALRIATLSQKIAEFLSSVTGQKSALVLDTNWSTGSFPHVHSWSLAASLGFNVSGTQLLHRDGTLIRTPHNCLVISNPRYDLNKPVAENNYGLIHRRSPDNDPLFPHGNRSKLTLVAVSDFSLT
ncbi:MAG: hypothetical protein KDD53_00860 [Bdellovibrionales bacterium]|nr:hypothetical protein [Bdellovibrionales bacterium]